MALKLNFLPEDLQINKGLSQTIKSLKALNVILAVAFIVSCLGAIGFFVFSKISLSNLQGSVEQLKSQVRSQVASEQKLILLKDRLGKISSIRATPNALKNINDVNIIFSGITATSAMTQADIDSKKADVSFLIKSNEDLGKLLTSLRENKIFNSVNISSLDYVKGSGYSVNVGMTNK